MGRAGTKHRLIAGVLASLLAAVCIGACSSSKNAGGPVVAKLLPFHGVTTDVLARSVPVVRARLAAAGYAGAVVTVAKGGLTVRSNHAVDLAVVAQLVRPSDVTFRIVESTLPPSKCAGSDVFRAADDTVGCYKLGPVLLRGSAVTRATANGDPAQTGGKWGVDVTFGHGDFAPIATQYVTRSVAIVVDGLVVSAPVINPGVTGNVVLIGGRFTRASARGLAAALSSRTTLPVPFVVSAA